MDEQKLLTIEAWVLTQVGPRRFEHIRGVVQMAGRLARVHGLPVLKAKTAAWLHDCAKEWPKKEMVRWIRRSGGKLDPQEKAMPGLWHPHAAEAAARLKWGIRDRALLEAVRCHTLGSPRMSPLARLLFVADFVETGRRFPGVELARRTAFRGLDDAVRLKASMTIGFLLEKNMKIHPRLLETWNHFCGEVS